MAPKIKNYHISFKMYRNKHVKSVQCKVFCTFKVKVLPESCRDSEVARCRHHVCTESYSQIWAHKIQKKLNAKMLKSGSWMCFPCYQSFMLIAMLATFNHHRLTQRYLIGVSLTGKQRNFLFKNICVARFNNNPITSRFVKYQHILILGRALSHLSVSHTDAQGTLQRLCVTCKAFLPESLSNMCLMLWNSCNVVRFRHKNYFRLS